MVFLHGASPVARLRALLNLLHLLYLLSAACWHVADVPAGAGGVSPCRGVGQRPTPNQPISQSANSLRGLCDSRATFDLIAAGGGSPGSNLRGSSKPPSL